MCSRIFQNAMRYGELLSHLRKGLRNGNWRRLRYLERCFYRAVLFYAKIKGRIVNATLIAMIRGIVEKLRETPSSRIFKAGMEEAIDIGSRGENVFNWCPQLKNWLKDIYFIFWLGLSRTQNLFRRSSV